MKRFKIVRNILDKIDLDNTLIVVYGDTLSKEIFSVDNDNILYLRDYIKPSVIIGMAMCTKKKIMLFCTNEDIVLNLDSFIQIALSKLKNIICIVLDGEINEDTGQSSLFRKLLSARGVLFNSGFLVHEYSHFFKKGKVSKELKYALSRVKGPICILIKTSKGVEKELKNVNICLDDNIKRFKGKLNG